MSLYAKHGRMNVDITIDYWHWLAVLFGIFFGSMFILSVILRMSSGQGFLPNAVSTFETLFMIVATTIGTYMLYTKSVSSKVKDNLIARIAALVFSFMFFTNVFYVREAGKFAVLDGKAIIGDETSEILFNPFTKDLVRFPDKFDVDVTVGTETWKFTFANVGNGIDLHRTYGTSGSQREYFYDLMSEISIYPPASLQTKIHGDVWLSYLSYLISSLNERQNNQSVRLIKYEWK